MSVDASLRLVGRRWGSVEVWQVNLSTGAECLLGSYPDFDAARARADRLMEETPYEETWEEDGE